MRGLIVCIAVVCLAFANGAPSDENSNVYTKECNYGRKEAIYSTTSFSKEELVYAVCEGCGDDKKCKVYVESANQDQNPVQSCDLSLKYTGIIDFHVSVFNAGNSRAVIAVRDGETNKFKVFSVNMKGCHISEVASFVGEKFHPKFDDIEFLHVEFVAHENNYDIFFPNKELCHDFYCKATLDYEGKVVKAASEFPLKYVPGSLYSIATTKHAYLIGEKTYDASNVYLVKDGDNKPNILYSGSESFIGLSTEANKLGFCVHAEHKLVCKQYDNEGKHKTDAIANPIGESYIGTSDILNLENGFFALTIEWPKISLPDDDSTIFAIHFDEQGKQGKFVKLVSKGSECPSNFNILPKLYKNSNGQYCVTSVCFKPFHSRENESVFSRNSTCFSNSELF